MSGHQNSESPKKCKNRDANVHPEIFLWVRLGLIQAILMILSQVSILCSLTIILRSTGLDQLLSKGQVIFQGKLFYFSITFSLLKL